MKIGSSLNTKQKVENLLDTLEKLEFFRQKKLNLVNIILKI